MPEHSIESLRYPMTVRTILLLLAATTTASAETPAFKVFEDAGLGVTVGPDKPVLSDKHHAALAACAPQATVDATTKEPSSGAVFYVEISTANRATIVKVRGTGKPTLDTCLEGALKKATASFKPKQTIGIAGRIDVKQTDKHAYLPSARVSTTAVMLPAHDAKWQLTVSSLGYTSNRALDLAAELSATSDKSAACASKRGATAAPAEAIAYTDGTVLFRSGNPAYDACVAKVIQQVKLPTAASAAWLKFAITAPAEPLAPRGTTEPGLDRTSSLKDALTTAVRSRKAQLLTCLDVHPNAKITKVVVTLAATKARIARAQTGDTGGDACVRKEFGEVAIPAARAEDKLELEVELSPYAE